MSKKVKCHWCDNVASVKDYREVDGVTSKINSCIACMNLSTEYLIQRRYDEYVAKLKEKLDSLENYEKGFKILYEYFDSISDEEKPIVDKQLTKLGL